MPFFNTEKQEQWVNLAVLEVVGGLDKIKPKEYTYKDVDRQWWYGSQESVDVEIEIWEIPKYA